MLCCRRRRHHHCVCSRLKNYETITRMTWYGRRRCIFFFIASLLKFFIFPSANLCRSTVIVLFAQFYVSRLTLLCSQIVHIPHREWFPTHQTSGAAGICGNSWNSRNRSSISNRMAWRGFGIWINFDGSTIETRDTWPLRSAHDDRYR